YPGAHQCNAVVLDTATVCRLDYAEISRLAAEIPGLQKQMFRLMSKDISNAFALTGDFTAEERLAAFLLGMSVRFKLRGYSATEFRLVMPRHDIANYLRLATETVSRVFKRFQDQGMIKVDRRAVKILDADKLNELARCVGSIE
ncbi:MAG: helix-turn-helix domain-containing protein, partial [Gammaproteobacteria bacterium]|nr:helix-turn-helix domain-containing protein [Gammaproteobacteria bacterium]